MSRMNIRYALAAAFVAAALAGCGSSGGDRGIDPGVGSGGTASNGSDIPQSALDSTGGLLAYLNNVIATMTNDTSEPLLVGNVALPVSDTTEPGG